LTSHNPNRQPVIQGSGLRLGAAGPMGSRRVCPRRWFPRIEWRSRILCSAAISRATTTGRCACSCTVSLLMLIWIITTTRYSRDRL